MTRQRRDIGDDNHSYCLACKAQLAMHVCPNGHIRVPNSERITLKARTPEQAAYADVCAEYYSTGDYLGATDAPVRVRDVRPLPKQGRSGKQTVSNTTRQYTNRVSRT